MGDGHEQLHIRGQPLGSFRADLDAPHPRHRSGTAAAGSSGTGHGQVDGMLSDQLLGTQEESLRLVRIVGASAWRINAPMRVSSLSVSAIIYCPW